MTEGGTKLWSRAVRQLRSFGLTGLDHALTSLSNVIVSTAVARAEGAEGLGVFQLVFAVYVIILGFQRQLILEPHLATPREDVPDDTSAAVAGASLIFAGISAALLLPFAVSFSSRALFPLLVMIPGLALQDAGRYEAFRRHRAGDAALLDGIWVIVSCATWPLVAASGATVAVTAWAAGGSLGAIVYLVRDGILPQPRAGIIWWEEHARSFGGRLAAGGLAFTIGTQAATFGVAAGLGVEQFGRLRAALMLLQSPTQLILAAEGMHLIPRLTAEPPTRRRTWRITAGTVGLVSLAVTFLLLLRNPLLGLLFGGQVDPPPVVLVAIGLAAAIGSTAAGIVIVLRALRDGRGFLRVYLVYPLGAGLIIALAFIGDITAAAWGYALQSLFLASVAVWWVSQHVAENTAR